MIDIFPQDPLTLASMIDIPLDRWPGNCHQVASAVRDLVPVRGMRLARGHWLGDVSRRSVYHQAPLQHSWLLLEDGRILDPTRWAITSPGWPEIYCGPCDHYDEGARALAMAMPPPLPGASDGFDMLVSRLSPEGCRELDRLLAAGRSDGRSVATIVADGDPPVRPSLVRLSDNLRMAARDDPDRVAGAGGLYRFIADNGGKALLPIDSWNRVMEPESLACRPDSNRWFALPEPPVLSDTGILSRIFDRFLSVEARPGIEGELAELGYSLEDDLWPCLNDLGKMTDFPIAALPQRITGTLSVIAGDLLGSGFGEDLKVERFAASLGADRTQLDGLLARFGRRAGYDLFWDGSWRSSSDEERPADGHSPAEPNLELLF